MIRSLGGKTPKIADSAWISETAYIVGDVEIGENSSVWPGTVIRADLGKIRIGKYCAIEDSCVVHSGTPYSNDRDLDIGDRVLVGHGAVINCRRIGSNVLIGMNATLVERAEIGNNCIIGAGSLVWPGMQIPDNSLVYGNPAEIKGAPTPQQLRWVDHGPEEYHGFAQRFKEEGL